MSDERPPAPYTKLRVRGLSPETLEAYYAELKANDALTRAELDEPPPQKVLVECVNEYEGPIDAILAALNTMAATVQVQQLPMERIPLSCPPPLLGHPFRGADGIHPPYSREYRRSFVYTVTAVDGSDLPAPEKMPEPITLTVHAPPPREAVIVRDSAAGRTETVVPLCGPHCTMACPKCLGSSAIDFADIKYLGATSPRPPLGKAEVSECYAGCGAEVIGAPGQLCRECAKPSFEV